MREVSTDFAFAVDGWVISITLCFCFSFQPLFQYLDTVSTEINSVPVALLLGLLKASASGKAKHKKWRENPFPVE